MKTKPLHIIIDGADNTGKTTLCKALGEKLGIPIVKMPNMHEYIKKHSAEEFSKLFNETIIQFKDYDFILDRGFTSSLAYSEVHHRDFDLAYIQKIEEELQPRVFITTGMTGGHFNYFDIDEVFSLVDTIKVDEAFVNLAIKRGYKLLEVNNLTTEELVKIICKNISSEQA